MTVQHDIYAVDQLLLWLEDNVETGYGVHFDNELEIHSAIALAALKRLLPHKVNMPFIERYLTVAVSADHLTTLDEHVFSEEVESAYSCVAKRDMGYFLKLWETLDSAKESEDFYLKLSPKTQAIIAEAIKQGAQCLEFDRDAEDSFVYKRPRVVIMK
ncbi:hypothetical protein TUM4438_10200 [Shewanella sairae]|uniref:Uncharacterized protein n=1 Tax=Shewanella sairae TaxID=190310 RepID=A0ABQ4P5P6_9GAMM|nr:hypothetical protein [Shewanella sairae]MCL1130454.1 hypothetical protein [Shewanella sairae]GIU42800.1 hypothetical protein TUM4438_10200 [Shewanella sairae]